MRYADRVWKETDTGLVAIKDRYYGAGASPALSPKEVFWLKMKAKHYGNS